jgi:hypothetical protein
MFIFQIGSTWNTASNARVQMINAGSGCNVFWQAGSSATLGTGSVVRGNVLSLTSVTLVTGSGVSGRLLARNGAVTLDCNAVRGCSAGGGGPVAGTADSVSTLRLPALIFVALRVGLIGIVSLRR